MSSNPDLYITVATTGSRAVGGGSVSYRAGTDVPVVLCSETPAVSRLRGEADKRFGVSEQIPPGDGTAGEIGRVGAYAERAHDDMSVTAPSRPLAFGAAPNFG